MSVIVLAVVKATVILVVALAASRIARRTRAAIRHVVLAVGFAGLLLLPVAMRLLPEVTVQVPMAPAVMSVETILPALSADPAAMSTSTPRSAPRSSGIAWNVSIETIVIVLWAAGALAAVLPLAASAVAQRRIRCQGTPFAEGQSLLNELAVDVGVKRSIAMVIHAQIVGPMTCGMLRPIVVFPPDAGEWAPADLRRAMRHELEHVRRADCMMDGLARFACAIYWFHPLVWTSWRRLRLEAERACDDAVLRADDAIAYADQLVTLAARVSARHAPLLAMASNGDLSRRVTAVLDQAQRRGRAGGAPTAGLFAGGLALVGLIAPVCASWQVVAADAKAFEVASIRENTSGDPFAGGDRQSSWLYPGGRFTTRNITLRELILNAYRWEITRGQLTGVSPWMDQRRFDIDARAADGAVAPGEIDQPRAQLMDRMLQVLLADRFKLRVRREQKTGDLHVLSVATGGPKLTPATDAPCRQVTNRGGLAISADPATACHMFRRIGRTGLEGVAVDTTDIAMALRLYLGRPVVDRAQLSSLYNVTVRWKPEAPSRSDRTGEFNTEPQADENDPDIYTAIREQLGLKLAIERAPIDMLVVESAEPPTAN
jgi:uncharacterized protein (TIGR03435 family)